MTNPQLQYIYVLTNDTNIYSPPSSNAYSFVTYLFLALSLLLSLGLAVCLFICIFM